MENGVWKRALEFRADAGCCGGMPTFHIGTITYPRSWSSMPSLRRLDDSGLFQDGAPRLTSPQDQRVEGSPVPASVVASPGQRVPCEIEQGRDRDAWMVWSTLQGVVLASGEEDDVVRYRWRAHDEQGNELDGFESPLSRSTMWQAPSTSGRYTLSCIIDDAHDDADDHNAQAGEVGGPPGRIGMWQKVPFVIRC